MIFQNIASAILLQTHLILFCLAFKFPPGSPNPPGAHFFITATEPVPEIEVVPVPLVIVPVKLNEPPDFSVHVNFTPNPFPPGAIHITLQGVIER